MRTTALGAWGFRLGLVLCTACQATTTSVSGPPSVAPAGSLTLEPETEGSAGLVVVSHAPEAPTTSDRTQIHLMFSRPLRGLSLAGEEPVPPIQIAPSIAGEWKWVGTTALVFVPAEGAVRPATSYRVTVPSGLRALDGAELAEVHRFEFETERPEVSSLVSTHAERVLRPDSGFRLRMTLPVSPATLERALTVEVRPRGDESAPWQRHPVSVSRPDENTPGALLIEPKAPLPLATDVRVGISPTLVSEAGPLPMKEAYERKFSTYRPLRAELSCNAGVCDAYPTLSFSNAVPVKALRRALSVTPALPFTLPNLEDEKETSWVGIKGPFVVGQKYRLRLGAGLRDRYGQKQEEPLDVTFSVVKVAPQIAIGASDGFLEPALGAGVPIASLNVDRYELLSLRLTPEQVREYHEGSGYHMLAGLFDAGKARRTPVVPGMPANRRHLHKASFNAHLGGPFGALALSYDWPGDQQGTQASIAVVHPTNLAVTTRMSAAGGLVWVTRMSDGAPVPRAKVRFVGLEGLPATFETDSGGAARIGAAELHALGGFSGTALAVAELGRDWSYARVPNLEAPPRPVLGSVFVERGIYRPGESVFVKGWLRQEQARGTAPLAKREASLVLKRGWVELARKRVVSSELGGVWAKFQLPQPCPLVEHTVVLEYDKRQFAKSFRVGEYKPTELSGSVTITPGSYVRGDELTARLDGQYLFGGPMAGVEVELSGHAARGYYDVPNAAGFQTDAWDYEKFLSPVLQLPGSEPRQSKVVLDRAGKLEVKVPTGARFWGPSRFVVSATFRDMSRQTISAGDAVLVHPGLFYLGVRHSGAPLKPNHVLTPEVVAIDPKGKRLGNRRVELSVFAHPRQRWGAALAAGPALARCELVTKSTPSSCPLELRGAGRYLVVARAKDERQNELVAATTVEVEGREATPEPELGSVEDLAIQLDRDRYRHGEVARALVTTPEPRATVLISVEGEGVLWHSLVTTNRHRAELEIPILKTIERNAEVVALAARGNDRLDPKERGSEYRSEDRVPALLSARTSLEIDQSDKTLSVQIEPSKATAAPGESVPVTLRVTDRAGKPVRAELAVMVVDEGVLSLTGFATPDPFEAFTPLRADVMRSSDSREMMGWVFEPQLDLTLSGFGSGHGRLGGSHTTRRPRWHVFSRHGGPRGRRDFRTTPYFNPNVLTGADGTAQLDVELSEAVTSFRVMAVGSAASDLFGSGTAHIQTQLPLMARPALPRFARVGDRFQAGILVSSLGVAPGKTEVRVKVSGVELQGPSAQTLRLGKNQTREARFAFSATKPGTAKLSFEVRAGRFTDRVETTLPVAVPRAPEAVATYGKTRRVESQRIEDLRAASRDYGKLQVSLSSTALVGLEHGLEQLIEYPYGCTEQLTSKLLPMLPLKGLADDFGLALPKNLQPLIDATIGDILARQRFRGGFGAWPDDSDAHVWTTAHALRVLDEAAKRGAPVPQSALEEARYFLNEYVDEETKQTLYRANVAFIAYVLAELGKPSANALATAAKVADDDPLFMRALALHALALSKDKLSGEGQSAKLAGEIPGVMERLKRSLEAELRLSSNRVETESGGDYRALFDSPARSTAMALSALLAVDPKHPLAERLARSLLQSRDGGEWRSTQEAAYALLALDRYRKAQEPTVPSFEAIVWLGQKRLGGARYQGRTTRTDRFAVAMPDLPESGSRLAFEKRGDGVLFYEALLSYSKKRLPETPIDRGFFVQHTLHALGSGELSNALKDGSAPGQNLFRAGDAVLGNVVVTTPTHRHFVVIEVPLPAGIEAIDVSLHTNVKLSIDHRIFTNPWHRRELRDDRVLFFVNDMPPGVYRFHFLARATSTGTFIVPPARAEEMYSPENFGRTGARKVEIR